MTKWIVKIALKFVSYETVVNLIAQGIAYLINYARTNASEEAWDKAKTTIKEIRKWTTLFDEIYEDDKLTEDEEKKIQEAIANCTATESIYDLIKGKKNAKK